MITTEELNALRENIQPLLKRWHRNQRNWRIAKVVFVVTGIAVAAYFWILPHFF